MATAADEAKEDLDRFARLVGGKNAFLIDLFEQHHERLFRHALSLVYDRESAKDIMQDLWEKVFRLCLEGKVIAEEPIGLLWTMAKNLSLDSLKKKRGHSSLDDLPEEHHPVASIPEPSHLEEIVKLALPQLPEAQREVLLLSTYSGLQLDEIAQRLGEPVGAVKTRAWRARTNLRKIIASMVGFDHEELGLR